MVRDTTYNHTQSQAFAGIGLRHIVVVAIFYLLMAAAYYLTLLFNVGPYLKPGQSFWEGEDYRRILLDYALKLVLTIPIWWIIFRALCRFPLWSKALVHTITLPLFVFGWKSIDYYFCDLLGYGRLRGGGEVWDIYIPALFYILQFALIHVYYYYRELQQEQKLSAELKQLAMQSEMNILKAQIHPHFLFNTLNSISAALPVKEEHTRELIARLADTFRFAMNTVQKESISLREELLFIQNYLCLEQERFGDRLVVDYMIDPKAMGACVPPFLLQPLIENALKHGIGKSVEGGCVTIKIKVIRGKLCFEIKDTGKGINGYEKADLFQKGIGLQNTHERLFKLFGEHIHIAPNLPKGTTVHFSIPYNEMA